MHRRKVLALGGLTCSAAVAGCVGSSDEEDSDPASSGGDTTTSTTEATPAQELLSADSLTDWPTYRQDRRNSGRPPDAVGPDGGVPDERWRFETEYGIPTHMTVTGGSLLVQPYGSNSTRILDASNGSRRAKLTPGRPITSGIAVADDALFAGAPSRLYAVDATTGERRWTFETATEPFGDREPVPITTTPAIANNTVFFAGFETESETGSDALYAADVETGEERWRFRTGEKIRSSPTVADETVYVVSYGEGPTATLHALDGRTGERRWWFETKGATVAERQVSESVPVVVDDIVYYGAEDGTVYALDSQTGERRWQFDTEGVSSDGATTLRSVYVPAATSDTLYVGSSDSTFYAIDTEDRTERWRFEADGYAYWSTPAVVDGTVYVGSNAGYRSDGELTDTDFWKSQVTAFDETTGDVLWKLDTKGLVTSPVVSDGQLYAAFSLPERGSVIRCFR